MSQHVLLVFLLQLAVLLVVAFALGRLACRLGLPAVVGELLTGVLLGPSLLGHLAPGLSGWLLPRDPAQMHLLDAVAQLAVVLLVGITGVQLDLKVLRRRRATALRISLAGLLIPFAAGVGVGYLLHGHVSPGQPDRVVFALFLGVAMCVSAIPVISKTLSDMGLLHRDVGQLTLTAGMVDDAVGWLLLSVVSALAGAHALGAAGMSVLYLALFVALAGVAGRPLVRAALRVAARSPEAGPPVVVACAVILAGAVVTHALGMEAVFGAFIAGILVGSAGPEVTSRLAPLRTVTLAVLAPIFLAAAGLRMDLTSLRDPDVLVAALVVLAVAVLGKFAGAYLGARLSRLGHWEGLALGAGMNARGVVEVVVAMVGLRIGVLNTAGYTIVVLVAIVTSVMAPFVLRAAMRRVEHSAEERLRAAEYDRIWSQQRAGEPRHGE
ncbi:Kef-type K+ transport system membrane component KefB [Saccharothrix coeruleofusca]|uniref:cation:proton antiporter n=1 Tax=Saccharothrix coeruleofusca TaxID=33919 RepID=UPI001FD1D86A|nr:cation:proton antiporter [Saccharothrix coeruleofusca]MBP2336650.1 Kef-type K+ transport system membrane component KefB [Saccharothrix coeruleofusca]